VGHPCSCGLMRRVGIRPGPTGRAGDFVWVARSQGFTLHPTNKDLFSPQRRRPVAGDPECSWGPRPGLFSCSPWRENWLRSRCLWWRAMKRRFGLVLSHISSHKVRGRRCGVPMVSQIDAVRKTKADPSPPRLRHPMNDSRRSWGPKRAGSQDDRADLGSCFPTLAELGWGTQRPWFRELISSGPEGPRLSSPFSGA
jgi:hypothetical protein